MKRRTVNGSKYTLKFNLKFMKTNFFGEIPPIAYEGPKSNNPLAFRHYNPEQSLLGKTLKEHLRFAACYWHNFVWPGTDPFGGATFMRPWFEGQITDKMQAARLKAEVAFEMFNLLGVPFFCFHDRDIAPEGSTLAESNRNVQQIGEIFADKMSQSGVQLLWGTANLFSHKRYMAGAATNPDPNVFAYAAAQVKNVLDLTHSLNGKNYVLWGGREGYETLLNTDLKKELDQLGRFLNLIIDYKHKIGFKGTILVEPKPQEPSKHQYDYDVATVYGFLQKYGLESEVKVNIEVGHSILAGHSFEHEVATALALGIFGSLDANRNDYQSGWDTDQFPNNALEMVPAFYFLFKNGGFTSGGLNFDSKLRRQSIEPVDLLYGHLGGMDCCAQAFKVAAAMMEDQSLETLLNERYAGWQSSTAQQMLAGQQDLDSIASRVLQGNLDPQPQSGRQEFLENLVNKYL